MAPPFIKGYLPLRVRLCLSASGGSDEYFDAHDAEEEYTYLYVKQHQTGSSSTAIKADDDDDKQKKNEGRNSTFFVANAPVVPRIQTQLLLKSIFGRYGDVSRVTVVPNPRRQRENASRGMALTTTAAATEGAQNGSFGPPSFLPTLLQSHDGSSLGKFAHVVMKSSKDLKRTLKALTQLMSSDDDEEAAVSLDPVELQTLADESDRLLREEDDDDEEDSEDVRAKALPGVLAVADRYRQSTVQLRSKQSALMDECNAVMEKWEQAEDETRKAKEAAANQPDEDGFVTVYHGTGTVQAELGGSGDKKVDGSAGTKRRARRQPRSRGAKKSKKMGGAAPVSDFYRFQTKETRQKTLHTLRERFQDDLAKVKQLKEEKQYRPF